MGLASADLSTFSTASPARTNSQLLILRPPRSEVSGLACRAAALREGEFSSVIGRSVLDVGRWRLGVEFLLALTLQRFNEWPALYRSLTSRRPLARQKKYYNFVRFPVSNFTNPLQNL
jgi:hypothetical protein